jgi:hypothetical protein
MADSATDPSGLNDSIDTLRLALDRLSKIAVWLSVGLAAVCVTVVIVVWFVTHTHYVPVGVGPGGQVIPLVRLNVAYLDDNRVAGFADETLRVSFAHDFENYPYTINALADRYTPDGFESFKQALAPFIQQMRSKRYVMSLSIDKPPIVVAHEEQGGVFTWTIQSQVFINRQGSQDRMPPTKYTAVMTITRIPLSENLRGVSTASVNLYPAT